MYALRLVNSEPRLLKRLIEIVYGLAIVTLMSSDTLLLIHTIYFIDGLVNPSLKVWHEWMITPVAPFTNMV